MEVKQYRAMAYRSRKRLDRGRRLYLHWAWWSLRLGSDEMLLKVVRRMKGAGLYARSTCVNDIARGIVTRLYKAEFPDCVSYERRDPWHRCQWEKERFPLWHSDDAKFRKRLREVVA